MTWKCIVYLFMIWSMQVHRISLSLYKQLRNKECKNSNSFGERHKSTGKSGRKFVRCGTSSRTKPSFSVWFETRAAVTAILFWRENGGGFRRKSPHCSEPGIRGNRNSCAAFGWKESRREETEGERESGGGRVLEREEKEAERFICYFPFLSFPNGAQRNLCDDGNYDSVCSTVRVRWIVNERDRYYGNCSRGIMVITYYITGVFGCKMKMEEKKGKGKII